MHGCIWNLERAASNDWPEDLSFTSFLGVCWKSETRLLSKMADLVFRVFVSIVLCPARRLLIGVIFLPPSSRVLYFYWLLSFVLGFTLDSSPFLGVMAFLGETTEDRILGLVESSFGRSFSEIMWGLPRTIVGLYPNFFLEYASIAYDELFGLAILFIEARLIELISVFFGLNYFW